MNIFKFGCLMVVFMAIVSLSSCRMGRCSDDNYYYGHGFGMGYGAGCFENGDTMMRDLNLSNEQLNKIRDVDSKYRKKYYENRGNFKKIDMLRIEHRNEINKILSKDQKENFDSAYKSRWHGWNKGYRRKHMGDYYGHGYGMGYGAGCFENSNSMMKELNLSDDQMKKITSIDSSYREKYYNNRGDFDKIDSLRREHRNKINNVLDEKQKEKYNDLYDHRWRGWGPGPGRGHHMMGY